MAEATVSSTLIKRNWFTRMKRRFRNTLVTSKLAILCLLWLSLANYFFLLAWLCWAIILEYHYSLRIIFVVYYLLYPCLGYLGVKCRYYHIIMVGACLTTISSILLQVIVLLFVLWEGLPPLLVDGIVYSSFIFFYLGLGLFTVNIIPFTVDQIADGCSEERASFTRWWVFVFVFSYYIVNLLGSFQDNDHLPEDSSTVYLYAVVITSFMSAMVFIFIGICFKRYFIIEPPPSVDPLKLIYNVLKYGYTHKYPERRSAFTYNDNPSRLDYGKTRYGGPFTTDQVESVKSFWYILAVLMPSTLFSYFTMNEVVSNLSVTQLNESFHDNTVEAGLRYTDSSYIIIIGIPLIQFIVKPFFPKVKLSMLKYLWIGLFLMTISDITVTVLYRFVSYSVFMKASIGLSLINNIGSAIILITSLEFIVAQAPSNMQGLLFGVYCLLFMADLIPVVVFVPLQVSKFSAFLCIATSLLCVSFIVYNLAMYCYKYRLRNELSDVNRRQAVEEIYERRLAIDSIQDEDDDEDIISLYSNTVQSHI